MSTNGKGAAAPDEMKPRRVQIEVDVPLDEAMCATRGMQLAQLEATRDDMKAKKKAASRTAQEEIDKVTASINQMASEIRTQSAKRMVDAEERFHFETNTVRTIRLDEDGYGIVASERPMTPEERQMALDLDLDADDERPEPTRAKRGRKPKADGATTAH